MPDDLADDSAATPPRPQPGHRQAPRPVRSRVERAVRVAVEPALVLASALLVAAQLLTAYHAIWPVAAQSPFQPVQESLTVRLGFLIAAPYASAPVLVAGLPVLVLAGLTQLGGPRRLPVVRPLRLAAVATSLVILLAGLALVVVTAIWTVTTRGEVTLTSDSTYFSLDPVGTFLSRGGDGLATAVLAGVAAWLLLTPPHPGDRMAAKEAAAAFTAPSVEAAVPPAPDTSGPTPVPSPATPATSRPPAPPATPGAAPVMPGGDPALFRRPDTSRPLDGIDARDSVDTADEPTSPPVDLFQRPHR